MQGDSLPGRKDDYDDDDDDVDDDDDYDDDGDDDDEADDDEATTMHGCDFWLTRQDCALWDDDFSVNRLNNHEMIRLQG